MLATSLLQGERNQVEMLLYLVLTPSDNCQRKSQHFDIDYNMRIFVLGLAADYHFLLEL